MRMEGEEEEEEEDDDVWSDDGSEEGSVVGSEGNEGGQGEGCSAVTKSLYTYGLQDRVLYDFCPASGRLVVATRGEIRVMDFLVPVPDLCVSFSFFDLGFKVDNFSFKCITPLYDSESSPPLTLLFNQLRIQILTCMYLRVPSSRELPGWDKNRFRLRDSKLECMGLQWNGDSVDTTLVWSRRRRCLRGSTE